MEYNADKNIFQPEFNIYLPTFDFLFQSNQKIFFGSFSKNVLWHAEKFTMSKHMLLEIIKGI